MNFKMVSKVQFPDASDIAINMMPFVMGNHSTIPEEHRAYIPLIEACRLPDSELGKVGYLTITESLVRAGESQRRGGVHTEKHPRLSWGGGGWGGSVGGLYLASSVDNSCKVWDRYIEEPGPMGDCSHMNFGEGTLLKAGELVWMTDGTPHETIPVKEDVYRQFFRVVTSKVSLWYAQHSTPNRLGVQPACRIVEGSKF